MSTKEQTHNNDKASAKPQAPQLEAQVPAILDQQSHLAIIIQRVKLAPGTLTPRDVQRLQRAIGNRAVSRFIQTKLMVGPAKDHYEQEADRVAEQVVSQQPVAHQSQPAIQRQEDEEEIQTKSLAVSITPLMQRQAEEEEEVQTKPLQRQPEEEEEVQTKSLLQRQTDGSFEAGADIEQQLAANKGSGSPLPADTRAFMEPRFGADFSGVRVHTDSNADQLNQSIQAKAFTTGQNLFFRQGEYQPRSRSGQELIAHELTHVIQQSNVRESNPMSLYAKTERGEASANILQRKLWDNADAKFQTANALGAAPSEYKVDTDKYTRYAPVNIIRGLSKQVFYENEPRSFVYIENAPDIDKNSKYDAVWEPPIGITNVDTGGGTVTFKTKAPGFEHSPEVPGKIAPTNGANVFDFLVDDTTRELRRGSHVGDAVTTLGGELPTLDNAAALESVREKWKK